MKSYIWVLRARPILRTRILTVRGKVVEKPTSTRTSRPNHHALNLRTTHSNTVLPNLNIARNLPAPRQALLVLRPTSHMYLQLISLLIMCTSQFMEGGLEEHHHNRIRSRCWPIPLPNHPLLHHGRMSCDMIPACHPKLALT